MAGNFVSMQGNFVSKTIDLASNQAGFTSFRRNILTSSIS